MLLRHTLQHVKQSVHTLHYTHRCRGVAMQLDLKSKPRYGCRRGWTAGQSFPDLDCLCRLMAFDDVPNMQPCMCVPGGVRNREPAMPPVSPPPLRILARGQTPLPPPSPLMSP